MQNSVEQHGNKIKICFVSPKAYPLFNPNIQATFGGAEVDLYYLGTELAKDPNYDVYFITADYGQADIERHENVTVIKSLSFRQNPISGGLNVWKALKKVNADMYMIKSISMGLLLVSLFCRIHHKIFLYRTAHTTHCDGTYLKRHPVMGRLFRYSIKQAEMVFVQNETDRENLKKTTGVRSNVISNGHRLNAPSQTQRKMILWVGRSAGFKHPERFLRLAKVFPQERFVMICQKATGDNRYESLRSKARQIENLTFVEHVRFNEIDRYFEQAKVFVNTSDSEGFANTFIQACKAGTAILSYSVNPDGFLDEYQCGICCHENNANLIDQLRKLLTNDYYLEPGRNGREYVRQKHDITEIIEQYKKLFLENKKSSESIRILHVIGNLHLGGAQVCLKQLVENNLEPNITQYIYPLRPKKIDIPIKGGIIDRHYRNYDIRKFFALLRICKQYKIDIIHAHLHKPIIGALLATFFCKAKVIAHEHGSIARPGIQYSLYRLMLRLLKKRAARFVAVSNAIAGQLTQRAGVDPARIKVIYNAVDLKAFTPNPEHRQTVREELGIHPDDIVIGFVGRLAHVKGPDILLDAFGLLLPKKTNCTLVFLGSGEMQESLLSKAKTLGVSHRVKFLGFRKNIAEIMNAFDIGCMPSRQEAFGIAALEFMSMKIPLVCSIPDGLAEIVSDGQNALAPSANTALSMSECILTSINDKQLSLSLTKRAYEKVQKFGIPELLNQVNKLYKDIKQQP